MGDWLSLHITPIIWPIIKMPLASFLIMGNYMGKIHHNEIYMVTILCAHSGPVLYVVLLFFSYWCSGQTDQYVNYRLVSLLIYSYSEMSLNWRLDETYGRVIVTSSSRRLCMEWRSTSICLVVSWNIGWNRFSLPLYYFHVMELAHKGICWAEFLWLTRWSQGMEVTWIYIWL